MRWMTNTNPKWVRGFGEPLSLGSAGPGRDEVGRGWQRWRGSPTPGWGAGTEGQGGGRGGPLPARGRAGAYPPQPQGHFPSDKTRIQGLAPS